MVKDPDSVYQPGRRGLGWLKLKKALATLDCVVVGVEWGHGKRRGVLSDYTFAVRASDEPDAPLLTIGKAYTGLTDAEIATMTEHFKSITLRDFGRYRTVHPEVVVEIAFDRIMRSSRHKSGFAMRFPRIVRMRDDKTPAEIDTLATVEALFGEQASGRILLARGTGGETERIAATGEAEGSRIVTGTRMTTRTCRSTCAATARHWDEVTPPSTSNPASATGRPMSRRGASGASPSRSCTCCPPTWPARTPSSSAAGPAYVSAWMARRGARVTGIDNSPDQLETARRLSVSTVWSFRCCLATPRRSPLPDGSFDVAISEYGAAHLGRSVPLGAGGSPPAAAGRRAHLPHQRPDLHAGRAETRTDVPATDRLLRP